MRQVDLFSRVEEETGIFLFRDYLSEQMQRALVDDVRGVIRQATLFRPQMKAGTSFGYQMTNCGKYGWMSGEDGYRYTEVDLRTGRAWPVMPESIFSLARRAAEQAGATGFQPESCLVNYYANEREHLGLHQDTTEINRFAPIVSISLGDTGVFALGGFARSDPTQDILLHSGDVLVMSGRARNRFHSLKRINQNSSTLLRRGGRLNLTIRQVY